MRSASGTGRPRCAGKIEHGTGWGRESCDESSDCVWIVPVCDSVVDRESARVGGATCGAGQGPLRPAESYRPGEARSRSRESRALSEIGSCLSRRRLAKGAVYKAIPKQPPLPHPLLHHPHLHLLAMPEGRSRLGRGERPRSRLRQIRICSKHSPTNEDYSCSRCWRPRPRCTSRGRHRRSGRTAHKLAAYRCNRHRHHRQPARAIAAPAKPSSWPIRQERSAKGLRPLPPPPPPPPPRLLLRRPPARRAANTR